jgi:hypothetical protein
MWSNGAYSIEDPFAIEESSALRSHPDSKREALSVGRTVEYNSVPRVRIKSTHEHFLEYIPIISFLSNQKTAK